MADIYVNLVNMFLKLITYILAVIYVK